ncbi:MAG: CBS domain-containing protein [Planctomycetota bacterium]|nr:MAG: CBS domain-containing protein [Planctomycetota bacterium]
MTTLRELLGSDPQPVQVSPEATVRDAAKAMAAGNVGCVGVMDGERLIGLFTERDILKRVLLQDKRTDETQVSEVMTTEIITGTPEQSAREGAALLEQHHIRHLPVVGPGQTLVGILSIRDMLRDELRQARRSVRHVQEFIQGGEAFEGEIRRPEEGA